MIQPAPCPFDSPRPAQTEHWDFVASLSISSLYLSTNQTYRGYCLLVFDPRHATRLDQLSPSEWAAYAADLQRANNAIVEVVKPDHMNMDLLGNIVQHLHWHIVPRRNDDGRWGSPIWTSNLADMKVTRLPAEERQTLIAQLTGALNGKR